MGTTIHSKDRDQLARCHSNYNEHLIKEIKAGKKFAELYKIEPSTFGLKITENDYKFKPYKIGSIAFAAMRAFRENEDISPLTVCNLLEVPNVFKSQFGVNVEQPPFNEGN